MTTAAARAGILALHDGREAGSAGMGAPLPGPRNRDRKLILMVDPRPLTRDGLARALEAHASDLRVVPMENPQTLGEGAAVDGLALVLLNAAGAGIGDAELEGLLDAARASYPSVPLVILSDRKEHEEIVAAVERGIRGYIPLRLDLHLVVEALRFVAAGGSFVPAEALLEGLELEPPPRADPPLRAPHGAGTSPAAVDGFTPRQLAVLELLQQGKSNKTIARDLDLPESTVKVHVRHIMKKLGATNRTQVAMLMTR
jgi:DNA-binding NarL/FixJ family response regulator